MVDLCRKTNTPCIPVCSKNDTFTPDEQFVKTITSMFGVQPLSISTSDSSSTARIIAAILEHLPETAYRHDSLLGDVINRGDTVVLVCPIDSSAPEGRLILPQVQVLRDVLDNDASAVVCKDAQLQQQLSSMAVPPRLVVTDSQVFGNVSAIVPASVPLTSFSVVLARAKGMFVEYLQGTKTIANLKDGDKVLLLESCTHNITCEDIGRVKIPKLLSSFTGKKLSFDVVAGLGSLAAPITDYSLVIQCGGCVVSPKQLASRLLPAIEAGVPVSNYGLTLAYVNGIFDRAIQIFQQKQAT